MPVFSCPFPGLTPRPSRLLASTLVLLVAAACGESSPQGPAPAPGGPASVSVTATIEAAAGGPASQQAGGGLGSAFDAADVAAVRVTASGGSALADREVAFDPGSGGAELRLELTIEEDRVPATVELALRRGADRLFEGATGLTLVAGETTTAELSLAAVPAAVSVPAGPVTFTALGDSVRLSAAVVFATGDTIPGLAVTWSSSDAAVVDVSEDGTVVADAPGTAEAVASHEGLTASVAVEVDPEVATVALEPDAVTFVGLGQGQFFEVAVTDANGNPVEDEPVTWSSTDAQVASVDGSGLAVSRGDGAALVIASAMGTADTATVVVDLGPTGRVSGRVGRVQPQASAAVAASASAGGGSSVGAAITTSPAGGVEVRFLQGGEVVSRTVTDSEGRWTSPALPPGIYTLEYASPELATVRHEGVEIGDGTTGSVADVPMVPASDQPGTMEGLVADVRTGGGVAGAAVEVHRGLEAPEGPVVASGTTGADGRYSISGVAAGTYTITASAPDFAPDQITGVALGGEIFGGQDLALVPPPEVTIGAPTDGATFTTGDVIPFRGSATDPEQGSLGGDALVWTSDHLADLIGTGESFTAGLPAGEHTVTLTATNERGISASASVDVTVEQQQLQLLTNGDFETGDFTGWTVTDRASGSGTFRIDDGDGSTPISGQPTVGPAGGSSYAVSDQSGPGTHALSQSFSVPAGASSVVLEFDMFVNNWASGVIVDPIGLDHTGPANQHGRVDILTAAAGPFDTGAGVLANLFLGADTGSPPHGYTHYQCDITSVVSGGGTFVLRFAEADNQLFFNLGVDNVQLSVGEGGSVPTAVEVTSGDGVAAAQTTCATSGPAFSVSPAIQGGGGNASPADGPAGQYGETGG